MSRREDCATGVARSDELQERPGAYRAGESPEGYVTFRA
ncbi:MAG: hypothetical protein OJF58_005321 [Enhydrobacter sp.]|nr:MAG: hypothetical protein OJF58_005321 [Enhydrobacter sp.]